MPTRRTFLGQTGLAAAAATTAAWPCLSVGSKNAEERQGFAQIGLGHGRWDALGHVEHAQLVALCDLDRQRLESVLPIIPGSQHAELITDYRKLLDRSDIGVISISTVDHWHVKIALEAMSAGKHVFCQKPLTYTLAEADAIAAARRRYPKCVFQVGTQQRADERFLRAVNLVQKGLIGKVSKVTIGIDAAPRGGPFPVVDPLPTSFDWGVWQGQTPAVPYRAERCHGTFRWWYEYSAGKLTDWGAHHIDIALWALNRNTPDTPHDQRLVRVNGVDSVHPVPLVDGYPTVDDQFNTAIDFRIVAEFADGLELVLTNRADNGLLFEGDRGRFFVNRGKLVGRPIDESWDQGLFEEADKTRLFKGKPFEGHKANFYRCIREGGETLSDTTSHLAAMDVCHLAAIASRLGRTIDWDAEQRSCPTDAQAAAMLRREQRAGYELPAV